MESQTAAALGIVIARMTCFTVAIGGTAGAVAAETGADRTVARRRFEANSADEQQGADKKEPVQGA